MPRAEKFTAVSKQLVYFSDIKLDLQTLPTSGELAKVTNEDSVKQSLRFLILTAHGEVPYNEKRGSKTKTLLFDPIDPISTDMLRETIKDTCRQEGRAKIEDVLVQADPNGMQYHVRIVFSMINITGRLFNLPLILKRVR